MKLIVTMAAAKRLIKQAELKKGDPVAIAGRKLRDGGFQIDYQRKQPDQPVAQDQQAGINFYVEFADEWFFSGKITTVDVQDGQLTYRSTREKISSTVPKPAPQMSSTTDASTAASRKYEEYWE